MPVPQRTSFTNLSQLINANQQNRLGSTIQSGVEKDVSGLKQDINQATDKFGNEVNTANAANPNNQSFVSNAINNIVNPAPPANVNAPQGQTAPTNSTQSTPTVSGTAPTQSGMVQALETSPSVSQVQAQNAKATQPAAAPAPTTTQASNLNALPGSFGYASTPTSGAQQTQMTNTPTAGDISKFGQLMKGGYTGPNQLGNLGALQAKGANIQDIGQNALRQGGLQNLLNQYVQGGNSYSRGEQALDTAILGQTGRPQLRNVLNSTREAGMLPGQAEANAEGLAAQTATGNQAFGRNVAGQLSAAQTPLFQQIQQQIKDQEAKNTQTEGVSNQIHDYLSNPVGKNDPSMDNWSGLNNANPGDTPSGGGAGFNPYGNRVGSPSSGVLNPTTDKQAGLDALQSAVQNGLISPQDAETYYSGAKTINDNPDGNLKTILQNSFNQYQGPANPYTVQQGANSDQAAKLNALSLLSGLGPQFSTYGGMAPGTSGFDATKFINQINALPKPAPAPTSGKATWY